MTAVGATQTKKKDEFIFVFTVYLCDDDICRCFFVGGVLSFIHHVTLL